MARVTFEFAVLIFLSDINQNTKADKGRVLMLVVIETLPELILLYFILFGTSRSKTCLPVITILNNLNGLLLQYN